MTFKAVSVFRIQIWLIMVTCKALFTCYIPYINTNCSNGLRQLRLVYLITMFDTVIVGKMVCSCVVLFSLDYLSANHIAMS